MALVDLYKALAAKLPDVPQFYGARYLAAHTPPPRIVWVPAQDRFEEAHRNGRNPQAVLTRSAGLDLHIWGKAQGAPDELADQEATELLLNDVLAALHDEVGGAFEATGALWGVREQDQWLTFGGAVVLQVLVDIPIVGETLREVVVKKTEVTHEFSLE